RDYADGLQRIREIPAMIEDRDVRVARGPFVRRDPDQPFDRLLGHRRMGAQRNQVVQPRDPLPKLLVQLAKQQRDGCGAGAIRNDDQHPLAIQWHWLQRARQQRLDTLGAQCFGCRSLSGNHTLLLSTENKAQGTFVLSSWFLVLGSWFLVLAPDP